MNALLEQLHDIEGLDSVSAWPLAMGWWVLIAIGIALMAACLCGIFYWLAFRRSWKHDTLKKLADLEQQLESIPAKESLMQLSEYLRRIALRRFSRSECAGLVGNDWLQWLARHDPKKYDWEMRGRLLIEAPYAPVIDEKFTSQIKDLIHAAREWV